MKITIVTIGSAGDVYPYVALTLGLLQRGHDVTLAASENFGDHIKSYGINYLPIFGNTQEILASEQGQKWIAAGNTKLFMKELAKLSHNSRYERQRDLMAACEGADVIIGGTLVVSYVPIISEKLKVPFIMANVNPINVATKAFPHFIVTPKVLPFGFLNRMTYDLFFKTHEKSQAADIDEWRSSLGLSLRTASIYKQLRKLNVPILHGYSNSLLPKPKDWEDKISVSGVWKLDKKYHKTLTPPDDFIQWLKAGAAPIYFGFGSMPVLNPQEMQDMVRDIC